MVSDGGVFKLALCGIRGLRDICGGNHHGMPVLLLCHSSRRLSPCAFVLQNSNEEHLLVCGTFGGSSFGLSLRFESSAMGSASTTLTSPVAASRHARSTSATGISEQLSINVFVVARSSSDQGDNQGANGGGGRFGLLSGGPAEWRVCSPVLSVSACTGLASSVGGVLGLSGWGGGSQASAKPQAIPHMRRSLLSRKVRASTVTGIVSVPPPDDAQL